MQTDAKEDFKKKYLEAIDEWRAAYSKYFDGKKLTNTLLAEILGISRVHLQRTLSNDYAIDRRMFEDLELRFAKWLISSKLSELSTDIENNLNQNVTHGNSRTVEEIETNIYKRLPKIADDPEREGVLFVPVAAQANYAKHYTERTYLNQLERVYIPGFPYRGDNYRIFEVAGDSMEPTFKEGYYVVVEYMEPTYWHSSISDFYVYVVVTESRVMLKRIFKKSEKEYVIISDNEEFHPQFTLPVEEIKEIWYVRRKIDWEMPPPKRFDITV